MSKKILAKKFICEASIVSGKRLKNCLKDRYKVSLYTCDNKEIIANSVVYDLIKQKMNILLMMMNVLVMIMKRS